MDAQEIMDFIKSELKLRAIGPEDGITSTRGWDSMGQVQLMLALEKKIGMRIPPDYFGRLISVKEILAFLQEQGKLTSS